MARLSILIPWQGSTATFENTVASVLAHRPRDCEVIVVHAGAYGDPWEIRREVLLVEHDDEATLPDLLSRGLEVAGGEVVHVLSCGVEATAGWTDSIWEHFETAEVGSLVPAIVDRERTDTLVCGGLDCGADGARRAVGMGRRLRRGRFWSALGPTLLAGFYRAEMLRACGGFDPVVGHSLLDADLACSARDAGWRCVVESSSVLVAEPSVVRAPSHTATPADEERLFWRHARHHGWLRSLASHAWHVGWRTARSLGRGGLRDLGTRLGVVLESSRHRALAERLREAGPDSHTAPVTLPFPTRSAERATRRAA